MTEVPGPARVITPRPGAGVTINPAKLIRLRAARVMSRAELAEKIGLTPDAVAKMENGRRRPKMRTFAKLVEALGCAPADLLPDPAEALGEAEPEREAERVPCPDCGALYGHEPGCPQAT